MAPDAYLPTKSSLGTTFAKALIRPSVPLFGIIQAPLGR